ncbi:hypothetical protein R3P38DRAFT_92981 [Favolaschia claudopus]|uniref:Uncharacterized protein n=1 Tax=Favolaschia claudopus TaxID=2862362 RepID=A0AAW0D6B3_9AGAR
MTVWAPFTIWVCVSYRRSVPVSLHSSNRSTRRGLYFEPQGHGSSASHPALNRLYWGESLWSASRSHALLVATPSLRHPAWLCHFPAVPVSAISYPRPTERKLWTYNLEETCDLGHLAHLTVDFSIVASNGFPLLPMLRTLTLITSSSSYSIFVGGIVDGQIAFPNILERFPNLELELRYDAKDSPIRPLAGQNAIRPSCVAYCSVRLYLGTMLGLPRQSEIPTANVELRLSSTPLGQLGSSCWMRRAGPTTRRWVGRHGYPCVKEGARLN